MQTLFNRQFIPVLALSAGLALATAPRSPKAIIPGGPVPVQEVGIGLIQHILTALRNLQSNYNEVAIILQTYTTARQLYGYWKQGQVLFDAIKNRDLGMGDAMMVLDLYTKALPPEAIGPTERRMIEIVGYYKELAPLVDEFKSNPSGTMAGIDMAIQYVAGQKTAGTTSGVALRALELLPERVGEIQHLLKRIDGYNPSAKAGIDLNARLTGQVAAAITELTGVQAKAAEMEAQRYRDELAGKGLIIQFLTHKDAEGNTSRLTKPEIKPIPPWVSQLPEMIANQTTGETFQWIHDPGDTEQVKPAQEECGRESIAAYYENCLQGNTAQEKLAAYRARGARFIR